jgi:hypothetical protein
MKKMWVRVVCEKRGLPAYTEREGRDEAAYTVYVKGGKSF